MKYKKISINPHPIQGDKEMTTVAIISGIAIGVAIGALFATAKGQALKGKMIDFAGNLFNQLSGNTRAKANAKLGTLLTDVSSHIKQNAEGLLGND